MHSRYKRLSPAAQRPGSGATGAAPALLETARNSPAIAWIRKLDRASTRRTGQKSSELIQGCVPAVHGLLRISASRLDLGQRRIHIEALVSDQPRGEYVAGATAAAGAAGGGHEHGFVRPAAFLCISSASRLG